MDAASFSDLAASRHSVRDFRPDPVPAAVLDKILDDARQAPSWSNTRPFMLALATGERADRLRAAYVREFDKTLGVQHKERGALAKLALNGGECGGIAERDAALLKQTGVCYDAPAALF